MRARFGPRIGTQDDVAHHLLIKALEPFASLDVLQVAAYYTVLGESLRL